MHTYIHTQTWCYRYTHTCMQTHTHTHTQIQRTHAEDNKLCMKLSSNLTPILMSNYRIRAEFFMWGEQTLFKEVHKHACSHPPITHTSMHTCASSVPMIHFQGEREGGEWSVSCYSDASSWAPQTRCSTDQRERAREIERRRGERASERARMREAWSQWDRVRDRMRKRGRKAEWKKEK